MCQIPPVTGTKLHVCRMLWYVINDLVANALNGFVASVVV